MNNKRFISMIGCVIFVVLFALVMFNRNAKDDDSSSQNDNVNTEITQAATMNEDTEIKTENSDNNEIYHNNGNGDNSADDIFFDNADDAQSNGNDSKNGKEENTDTDANDDAGWSDFY